MILVSPAEPAKIKRALASFLQDLDDDQATDWMTSPIPEKMGVDFAWVARGTWWGVQRKEIGDLLASMDDGRLALEIGQMISEVASPQIILEGPVQFTSDGALMTRGWSRSIPEETWYKRLYSIADLGVQLTSARDHYTTISALHAKYLWSKEEDHSTGRLRPKPPKTWGKLKSEDFQRWFLQSFPRVGFKRAQAIIDELGFPFQLTCTREEMLAVDGIGPDTVDTIFGVMEGRG